MGRADAEETRQVTRKAIAELAAAGEKVTTEAILKKTRRGSATTVSDELRQWRKSVDFLSAMPPEAAHHLASALNAISAHATENLRQLLEHHERDAAELAGHLGGVQRDRAENRLVADLASEEVRSLNKKLAEAESAMLLARSAADDLAEQKARWLDREKSLNNEIERLRKQMAKADERLTEQLDLAHERFDELRRQMAANMDEAVTRRVNSEIAQQRRASLQERDEVNMQLRRRVSELEEQVAVLKGVIQGLNSAYGTPKQRPAG